MDAKTVFKEAQPIWPEGRGALWNQFVGFHATWIAGGGTAVLRITAADYYRLWCNGRFAGFGPARAAHGFARVDEWRLDAYLQKGTINHLAIEVLSYGIDSYAHAMQPPFLQAELMCDEKIVAATRAEQAPNAFTARVLHSRVQKVERYSGQRAFAEAYRLKAESHAWRTRGGPAEDVVSCEVVEQRALLPRWVPYPTFHEHKPADVMEAGAVARRDPATAKALIAKRGRMGTYRRGYPVEEYEIDITASVLSLEYRGDDTTRRTMTSELVNLAADSHILFDFGAIRVGFIGVRLRCQKPARVFLVFDERNDRPVDQVNVLGVGAVALELAPGCHDFETIEIYGLRYLRVVCLQEDVVVERVFLREYANSGVDMKMQPCSDPELAEIFDAGRETFRTNAVDLFTDCQSRERGGYPCDAWFTAQSERLLTGASSVERNFLENFLLPDAFRTIPPGMLPHCYPSDRFQPGRYIPNWAMWLFIQFADYVERSGDRSLLALAEKRAEALFNHLATFRNELGLLENLEGWVFVEHSAANDYTAGVNHPTNLVYAATLDACSSMFKRDAWSQEAATVRKAVRELSWDGRWFADQSVRADGQLKRTAARSETCQYHAFWFGIADPKGDAELWRRLRDEWGPFGNAHQACWGSDSKEWFDRYAPWRPGGTPTSELIPANLFYGCMLRFELLLRYGETERLKREIKQVFLPQARLGGTLWELLDPSTSCNHGFGSRVCALLAGLAKETGNRDNKA